MAEVANFVPVWDPAVVADVDEAVNVLPFQLAAAACPDPSIVALRVFSPIELRALATRPVHQTGRLNVCTFSLDKQSPDLVCQTRVLGEKTISSILPRDVHRAFKHSLAP